MALEAPGGSEPYPTPENAGGLRWAAGDGCPGLEKGWIWPRPPRGSDKRERGRHWSVHMRLPTASLGVEQPRALGC